MDALNTSQKFRRFTNGPMKNKKVITLAGIGKGYRNRLAEMGINKAYHMLGYFLTFNMDRNRFVEWLWSEAHVDGRCANACFNCLEIWCNNYL